MAVRLPVAPVRRLVRRLDYDWITPEIAVGAQFPAGRAAELAQAGIDSVLDLRAEAQPDVEVIANHGLRVLHIPVADGDAPSAEQMWQAVGWVEGELAQERSVLVHCRAGLGRSVLVVCAVLMVRGSSPAESFAAVKQRRPSANLTSPQRRAAQEFWISLAGAYDLR